MSLKPNKRKMRESTKKKRATEMGITVEEYDKHMKGLEDYYSGSTSGMLKKRGIAKITPIESRALGYRAFKLEEEGQPKSRVVVFDRPDGGSSYRQLAWNAQAVIKDMEKKDAKVEFMIDMGLSPEDKNAPRRIHMNVVVPRMKSQDPQFIVDLTNSIKKNFGKEYRFWTVSSDSYVPQEFDSSGKTTIYFNNYKMDKDYDGRWRKDSDGKYYAHITRTPKTILERGYISTGEKNRIG